MTAPAVPVPAPAPRVRVPATPLTSPARFGLFSAARMLDNADPHELNGVEYTSVCSTQVDPYPVPCGPVDAGLSATKEAQPTSSWVVADPMALYAADDCALVGRDSDTAVGELRARFLAGEQSAVEYAIGTGEWGNSPSLPDSALLLNGGVGLDLPDAVGLLEAWLADTVGAGIIHAPRYLTGRIDPRDRASSGQRSVTALGNTWSWGNYPATAPLIGGADDGSVWLYATAPVTVRRGPLVEPATWTTGGFDPTTNAGFLLVERMVVVDWPCRAAAVQTNVPRLSTDTTDTAPGGGA